MAKNDQISMTIPLKSPREALSISGNMTINNFDEIDLRNLDSLAKARQYCYNDDDLH